MRGDEVAPRTALFAWAVALLSLAACSEAANAPLTVGPPDAEPTPDATRVSRDALIALADAAPGDGEGLPDPEGDRDAGLPGDAGTFVDRPALRTCAPVEVPPAPPARSWHLPTSPADGLGAVMGRAHDLHAAIEGHGDAVLAWAEEPMGEYFRLERVQRRGGVWGAPEVFSGVTNARFVSRPRVALDDCGDGLITWVSTAGDLGDRGASHVFLSQLRDGAWIDPAGPEDFVSLPGSDARDPEVAIDERGEALVAWAEYSDLSAHIWFREYREGRWSEPQRADPGDGYAQVPLVALGDDGSALIVWQESAQDPSCADCRQIFMSERRDGVWRHPRNRQDHIFPAPGRLVNNGAVAIAGSGDAVVFWSGYGETDTAHLYRSERSGGAWHHPASVVDFFDPPATAAVAAEVAGGAGGDFALTWMVYDAQAGTGRLAFADRRAGAWALPVTDANLVGFPGELGATTSVAMDAYGDTTIVYTQRDPDGVCSSPLLCERVLKSERRGGAWYHATSFADAIGLDGRAEGPVRVVASAPGEQVIAWIESNGLTCGDPLYDCLQIYLAEWR